jgi:hypothetical protein
MVLTVSASPPLLAHYSFPSAETTPSAENTPSTDSTPSAESSSAETTPSAESSSAETTKIEGLCRTLLPSNLLPGRRGRG